MPTGIMRGPSIFVLLMIIASRPGSAAAAPNMAIEEMGRLNEGATRDLQAQDVNTARRKLDKALDLARQAGVDKHPAIARTHLLDGVLLAGGLGDSEAGCAAFREALRIDPKVRLGKALSTAALEKLMSGARAKTCGNQPAPTRMPAPAAAALPGAADGEPDLPVRVQAIDCPSPAGRPGDEILIRCATAPSLKAVKSTLFYRPQGREEFTSIPMTRSHKGWWIGTVPSGDVKGTALQFFVEARNDADKPVASNGRADSPDVIALEASRRTTATEDACKENPLLCPEAQKPRDAHRAWIGFGIGWGLGLVLGDPEVRKDLTNDIARGLSFELIPHAVPEIGLHLTNRLAVAIQGRHQYIYQPAKYQDRVARGAHAILARAMYFFADPGSQLRPFAAGILGGGDGFRLTFVPDDSLPDMKDTVRGGPVVFGAGAGVMVQQWKDAGWVAGANLLAGAPDFNVVLDLNVGVYLGVGHGPLKAKPATDDEEPGALGREE